MSFAIESGEWGDDTYHAEVKVPLLQGETGHLESIIRNEMKMLKYALDELEDINLEGLHMPTADERR